jgi:hypothetical protein
MVWAQAQTPRRATLARRTTALDEFSTFKRFVSQSQAA